MKDNKNISVLHLARWYPNRYDPMPGLFIQRHAEAANIYCNSAVVYTHLIDDESEPKYTIDYDVIKGVPTSKVYYRSSICKLKPIKKAINIFRFYNANRLGINKIREARDEFEVIHVHILSRLGVIALYYKFRYGIPFIITEHWSRYLDLTGDYKGFLRKKITSYIVKKASTITAVTKNLAGAMKKHGLNNPNYTILPNVVDSSFLRQSATLRPKDKFTFIHISCFEDKSKNISGLLRVIQKLSSLRSDFNFVMVGDGMDFSWLKSYSEELGLNDEVITYTGLLQGEELVSELSKSDMLVIFSNYENFPVVINESLTMGIPVISTNVGGISERINSENGVLVTRGDEEMMLIRLMEILDKKITFDMASIQNKYASEFSAQTIGATLFEIYQNSITQN